MLKEIMSIANAEGGWLVSIVYPFFSILMLFETYASLFPLSAHMVTSMMLEEKQGRPHRKLKKKFNIRTKPFQAKNALKNVPCGGGPMTSKTVQQIFLFQLEELQKCGNIDFSLLLFDREKRCVVHDRQRHHEDSCSKQQTTAVDFGEAVWSEAESGGAEFDEENPSCQPYSDKRDSFFQTVGASLACCNIFIEVEEMARGLMESTQQFVFPPP